MTLVWIEIPRHGKRGDWLKLGGSLFDDLWRDRDQVVAFARQQSRKAMPDFWTVHDLAGTSGVQMMAWGLWINPEERSAVYEVNQNHAFVSDLPDLPEFPEDEAIMVRQDAQGGLSLQNLPV